MMEGIIKEIVKYVWKKNDEIVGTDDVAEYFMISGKYSVEPYNAYDYVIDGRYLLLNTYGEEDVMPNDIKYCIALLDMETGEFALIDVKRKCTLGLQGRAVVPRGWINKWFGGKRAFYWYRANWAVSLRIDDEIYEKLDENIKHKEAEEWISGPRVFVPVEKYTWIDW